MNAMNRSQQVKESAVARYLAGESSVLIARDLGCTPTLVLIWVRNAGGQVRGDGSGPRHQCRHCDEIVARYISGQESRASLARRFGVRNSTIEHRLRHHGVKLARHKHLCGTRCQAIIAGYRLGRSLQRLGQQEGVTRQAIQQLLARHGVARRHIVPPRLSIVAVAEALGRAGANANGAVDQIRAIVPADWQPMFDLVLHEGAA